MDRLPINSYHIRRTNRDASRPFPVYGGGEAMLLADRWYVFGDTDSGGRLLCDPAGYEHSFTAAGALTDFLDEQELTRMPVGVTSGSRTNENPRSEA